MEMAVRPFDQDIPEHGTAGVAQRFKGIAPQTMRHRAAVARHLAEPIRRPEHPADIRRGIGKGAELDQLARQPLFDQRNRFIHTVKRNEPAEPRPLGSAEQDLVNGLEPVTQRFEPVILADGKDQ